MENEDKKYLSYSGGKGYVFVAVIALIMAAITIGYTMNYFIPDRANWNQEGVNPDKVIWKTELGK